MVDTCTKIFFIRFDRLGVMGDPGHVMIDAKLGESLSGPGSRPICETWRRSPVETTV